MANVNIPLQSLGNVTIPVINSVIASPSNRNLNTLLSPNSSISIPSTRTQIPNGPVLPTAPTSGGSSSTAITTLSLEDLTDVVVPKNTPYGGYALTYDATNSVWSPEPPLTKRMVYISVSITGTLVSGEILMQYAIPEAIAIPAGGALGSSAIAVVASSTDVIITINKNNINIGTIKWEAGNTIGTINLASKVNLVLGDVLQLVAPTWGGTVLALARPREYSSALTAGSPTYPTSPTTSTAPTIADIGVTFACVRGG